MRRLTRSHHLAGAAAVALALTLGACGSDGSDDGSGEEGSSSSASTSADSSGSGGESSDEGAASGSDTLVINGTTVDRNWRPVCQRSDDGKKGAIDLLDLPSLDEVQESGQIDGTTAGADFDLDGDEATLTRFQAHNDSSGRDGFDVITGNKDDMTITYSEEAVRVEGTGTGTIDGKEREDIPFSIDIGCSTWVGLTNEGDVAPPG